MGNTVGGISNIRATDGGNIASFRSKDSKIGQYIDINSERVVINYMENGEWKTGFVLASKSDLPKYDIKTFTVDVTTQTQNSNGKCYAEKNLSTETWYSSAKAIVPLFARKSGFAYICMAEIEHETLRVQADVVISGVTVGILVVS